MHNMMTVRVAKSLVSNVNVDSKRGEPDVVQFEGTPLNVLRASLVLESTGYDCEIRETSRGWVGFARLNACLCAHSHMCVQAST